MQIINMHEAITNFSKLMDAVGKGEEIVITKAGKPAAQLVPIQQSKTVRIPGALRGKIHVAGDFDAPLPAELQAAFEGR